MDVKWEAKKEGWHFFFFDICPGIFVLFEWMEYSELQGNTNVDILHPKVKVKFLSRLGD